VSRLASEGSVIKVTFWQVHTVTYLLHVVDQERTHEATLGTNEPTRGTRATSILRQRMTPDGPGRLIR